MNKLLIAKYFLTPLMTLAVCVFSYILFENALEQQADYLEKTTDIHALQLSIQKLNLLSDRYFAEQKQTQRDQLAVDMDKTMDFLLKIFNQIKKQSPYHIFPASIESILFGHPFYLEQKTTLNFRALQDFISKIIDTERRATLTFPITAEEMSVLVSGWDSVSEKYKEEMALYKKKMIINGIYLILFLFFLIVADVLFISMPINRKHTRTIDALERENQLLLSIRSKLEKENKTKMRFISTMSYELRNPLNGILGIIELMHDVSLTAQQREMLALISSSTRSLGIALNDLVDYAFIESGTLKAKPQIFNLRSMLKNVIDIFETTSRDKEIPLILEMNRAIPLWVEGDADRLKQILANLIGNALKFTISGSVTIQVSQKSILDEDITLLFSVVDTGTGIPQQKLGCIFDAQNPDENAEGGTHFGLLITKNLVEILGGNVWVESVVGIGSTFSFTTKLKKAQPPSDVMEIEENAVDSSFAKVYPARILVVEDNDVNQKVAVGLLKKLGYFADIANNGVEALEKFKQGSYDVVFMDLRMPEMDGYTAKDKILNLFAKDLAMRPKIIAMTASLLKSDLEGMMKEQWDGYIMKPTTAKIIAQAIMNAHNDRG